MELNAKSLALEALVSSPHNTRKHFDEARLKDLTASIKEKGVIEPIIVRPLGGAKFEVVCGERRFRASKAAGLKEINALIRELDDRQAFEFQVIENLQREDVHPIEEAEGYETLMKTYGYKTVADIAVKVGKSKEYIYGRLKLCALTPENRKLFYDGSLNPSVALLVARIPAHLQKEAGKKITAGGADGEPMSYRRAKEFISSEFMLVLKAAPFDTDDAMLADEAGSCTLCQKRTGNQKELFVDIASADVCTDPVCFKAKCAAGVKRALAKAKESGKTVLSEKEAKKVFFSTDNMNLGEGYINLEAICEEDKLNRKYKQLVKLSKDAKIAVAVNPHSNELVAMITRTEASRIRKQLGIVPVKAAKEKRKTEKAQKSESRAQEKREVEDRKKFSAKVIEEILTNVRRDTKKTFVRALATGMLEAASAGVQLLFLRRRDPEAKRDGMLEKVREHLAAIDDSELLGFCLELVMLAESEWGEDGDTARALCSMYSIDAGKIKKDVEVAPAKVEVEASTGPDAPEVCATCGLHVTVKTNGERLCKCGVKIPGKPAGQAVPEKPRVKMHDKKSFEYQGKSGRKVLIKTKGEMSFKEQEAVAPALKELTDTFGEDK